jgi:VIT1/CCC1 family predicted Fe2+/Mn2+ transporter
MKNSTMHHKPLNKETERIVLTAQRNEITEYFIYRKLAKSIRGPHNRDILTRIAEDELRHHNFWKSITQQEVRQARWKIWVYYLISRIFGITFGIKLMERGEGDAQVVYRGISAFVPNAEEIAKDEDEHERQLINLIDEERLTYIGSMVLGLNDALVELTGALAGLTLALQHTRLIAMTGFITGIAASFSMAASEYLSTKSEEDSRDPVKASLYTGSAYVLTVLFLIFPYLLFENYYFCLGFTLFNAILVILIFTFYISVAKEIPFRERFIEMASISLGIAALTFIIGLLVRMFMDVEI